MPNDLTVLTGTTVVLDDKPTAEIAPSLEKKSIKKLKDLVTTGAVESDAKLITLLDAAKSVTSAAISRRETYTPFEPIHGTPE